MGEDCEQEPTPKADEDPECGAATNTCSLPGHAEAWVVFSTLPFEASDVPGSPDGRSPHHLLALAQRRLFLRAALSARRFALRLLRAFRGASASTFTGSAGVGVA